MCFCFSVTGKKRKNAASTPAPVQTLHVTPSRARRSTRKEVNYNEAEMAAKLDKKSSSSSEDEEEEDSDEEEDGDDENEENFNPNPEGIGHNFLTITN